MEVCSSQNSFNPLNIDLIRENVLSYLSVKELFRMRLVSKIWEETAFKEIIIKDADDFVNFSSLTDVQKYLKTFSTSITPFHSRFAFIKTGHDPICKAFFEVFGAQIICLKILSGHFLIYHAGHIQNHCNNLEDLQLLVPSKFETIDHITTDFPISCRNIKSLTLAMPFVHSDVFLEISRCPSRLSQLTIGSETSRIGEVTKGPSLIAGLERMCFRDLTSLKIHMFISERVWDILTKVHFHLEELFCGMGVVQESTLRNVMNKHADTLRCLTTIHPSRASTSFNPQSFPLMKKLKVLKVVYGGGSLSELLTRIPEIEELELRSFVPHTDDLKSNNGVQAMKLKTLTLTFSRQYGRERDEGKHASLGGFYAKVGNSFPVLETFHVATTHLVDEEMQGIFKGMVDLKQLSIVQRHAMKRFEITDRVFTGVKRYYGEYCMSFRDMKKLQVLKLSESINLTDTAITLGVSKCKTLRHLHICSRNFTGNSLILLANTLTELQTLNFGARYEILGSEPIRYYQERMYRTVFSFEPMGRRRSQSV